MTVQAGTRLLAVAGDPVAHSLSPVMHNAAIRALGLDAVYVAARTTAQAFPALVREMLAAGGALNVTAPFKFQAATLVDEPTDEVRLTGACNTIWGEPDRVCGDNTDIVGIRTAARALVPGTLRTATISGTGAAARSAAIAVSREWPRSIITVLSRSASRAQDFVAWAHGAGVACRHEPDPERFDLLVSTLPAAAYDGPAGAWHFQPAAVLDMNYAWGGTSLTRKVSHLVARCADGRGVLIAQGAAAFERFFGVPAPVEVMRRAVEDALRL